MNPGIIIQCRLTSSRFPNKALYPILGKTTIDWVIEACKKTDLPMIIAIPNNKTDRGLEEYLKVKHKEMIDIYIGNKEDLILRFLQVSKIIEYNPIIRVCGDAPFLAPEDIQMALAVYNMRGYHTRINNVECFGRDELEYYDKHCHELAHREHCISTLADATLDYPEDADRIEREWKEGSPTMDGRKRLWGITHAKN